jgi:hypothetical protein
MAIPPCEVLRTCRPDVCLSMHFFILFMLIFAPSALLFHRTEIGASNGISTPSHCRGWVIFQATSLQLLVNGVHLILTTRGQSPQPYADLARAHHLHRLPVVYALYNRSRAIAVLLGFSFVTENVFMTRTWILTIPHVRWTETCAAVYVPLETNWFGYA